MEESIDSLTSIELRILGALIEKQIATPDYYPLTINSLVSACNQKSARLPVTSYTEEDIQSGLDSLREKRYALRVDAANSRVAKFRHQIDTPFENIEKKQIAVLCVLLLRGPQTLGEIRTRTERLFMFRDLAEVDETVQSMIAFEDPGPIAVALPREPGRKERRYTHLLGDDPVSIVEEQESVASNHVSSPTTEGKNTADIDALVKRIETLEDENIEVKSQLEALSAQFETFKKQFD